MRAGMRHSTSSSQITLIKLFLSSSFFLSHPDPDHINSHSKHIQGKAKKSLPDELVCEPCQGLHDSRGRQHRLQGGDGLVDVGESDSC